MKNLKDIKKKEKILREFLKQRNLSTNFRRFKAISSKRKRILNIRQSPLIKRKIIVFKQNDKVIIKDFFSLKTLATTKKFNLNNIRSGIESSKEIETKFLGKKISKLRKLINFNVLSETGFKNTIHVQRNRPVTRKVGKVFLGITFIKGKQRQTAEGGSQKNRLLTDKGELLMSYNEAFKGALSVIQFSYESFIINFINYSYVIKRQPVRSTVISGENVIRL